MSEGQASDFGVLPTEWLDRLGGLDVAAALPTLIQAGYATSATVAQLADAALAQADTDPRLATQWLAIARALNQATGDQGALLAQIEYAQARLYVHTGDLVAAEMALRAAQTRWLAGGDQAALTRSYLGLTDILARQGRYAEAETIIRQAIDELEATSAAETLALPLLDAHYNLASLLSYQERHLSALEEYTWIQQVLAKEQAHAQTDAELNKIMADLTAHVDLNRGLSLIYLDQPDQAELALQLAVAAFSQLADPVNRARAYINLGILALRTGRYASALGQFDLAANDLLGESLMQADGDNSALHQADMLLLELERAMAYVALNLVPEATSALERCVALYQQASQPYEWGQSLFALGMVHLRTQNYADSTEALTAAEHTFSTLQNRYWMNRTTVALAYLAYHQGDMIQASSRLVALPAVMAAEGTDAASTLAWDIGTLVEGHLLRLRLQLDQKATQAARQTALLISQLLGNGDNDASPPGAMSTAPEINQRSLPHLQLRLQHALGRIEWQDGHYLAAQAHLAAAIDLLEAQRITLPLEEIRTAFIDDKTDIYNDLILVQLADPVPTLAAVAAAFATLERARSRALLERLLATDESTVETAAHEPGPTDLDQQVIAQREETRRELHWLYNQLFNATLGRRTETELRRAIQQCETQLQQLEWRTSPLLLQSQPVRLALLQAALDADQQALLYHIADDEVLAFVVDAQGAQVVRRLCTAVELRTAQAELDFQLGRAALGSAYLARHAVRLQTALQAALFQLYQLLIAPLAHHLRHERLLLIPYGDLHLLPFHALWDGQRYLIEHFECTYAPSAGVAVHCQKVAQQAGPFASFAGLAVGDVAIPQAITEIETAASYFDAAWIYLNDAANYQGLQQAAHQADILHLATHGLFRPDNPFFSALKLADGWIDVRQLYRLPLTARLVVLSACQSGAGRVQGGDEVIGLARGFLGAGAHRLLVSLWNVHDASAIPLMADFYRHLTAGSAHHPAAALRTAQLAAIHAQQHPYFWAPFLTIG